MMIFYNFESRRTDAGRKNAENAESFSRPALFSVRLIRRIA